MYKSQHICPHVRVKLKPRTALACAPGTTDLPLLVPTVTVVPLQIEGAYVMGLGMMLSEEVSYHGAYGSLLTNSTWHYKPPAATCVPQQLNITVLDKAPLAAAVG